MLTTLEIMEFALVGIHNKIINKKRVLESRTFKKEPTQDVEKELEELKDKYSELEFLIFNEKYKMI